jgi:four helix bundle protein
MSSGVFLAADAARLGRNCPQRPCRQVAARETSVPGAGWRQPKVGPTLSGTHRAAIGVTMPAVRSHRDLEAWRIAVELAEACYRASEAFPSAERFGLTQQLRRAAVSVPANIAEGHRRPRAAYLNHLSIALGSHAELDTCLELAAHFGWIVPETRKALRGLMERSGQLLHGLVRSLQR